MAAGAGLCPSRMTCASIMLGSLRNWGGRRSSTAVSWSEMKFIFAISYAQAIQAFVAQGEEALRSELERWEPEARATVAQALAEVA